MDWFLYDNGLRHEGVNSVKQIIYTSRPAYIHKDDALDLPHGNSIFHFQFIEPIFCVI